MRLHTSLQAKFNEPMTALTAAAALVIDPALANGMGSLQEDAVHGLRCPVRGCGRYFHSLRPHWNRTHADIGGAPALGTALSIPATAALESQALLARRRRRHPAGRRMPPTRREAAKGGPTRSQTARTVGARNLRSRCEAQLRQQLAALHQQLGRTPTVAEADVAWGAGALSYITRLYGSWNNFKRHCGEPTLPRGGQPRYTVDDVISRLKTCAAQHGELPTSERCQAATGLSPYPVQRALSASRWHVAMMRAALILDLKRSRYFPKQQPRHFLRRCRHCAQLSSHSETCEWCHRSYEEVA